MGRQSKVAGPRRAQRRPIPCFSLALAPSAQCNCWAPAQNDWLLDRPANPSRLPLYLIPYEEVVGHNQHICSGACDRQVWA